MAGRILSRANETKLRSALTALGEVLGLLDREPEAPDAGPEAEAEQDVTEALDVGGEFVPLVERALRVDGTIPVKLIAPGWGSSGFYPAEVLERDGPRIFTAGTKMFWNHPTLAEETARPEGDLHNLAAELVSDARWDGAGVAGPGLYADARVFGSYKAAVEELAPHIGVSIRAAGRAEQGTAEGRKGPIIASIVDRRSVDFVTEPGAGGKIVQMFEAARRPAAPDVDVSEDNARLHELGESMDEEKLREAQAQVQAAQAALAEMQAQNARLQETLLVQEAREFARVALGEIAMPEVTRKRLVETLASDPPVVNGELDRTAFQARISEVARAEMEYLNQAAGLGRIQGMGSAAGGDDGGKTDERMREAFVRLGLSEASAQVAAVGRLY